MDHESTSRREGDLNTRTLAGTVVPARPLGRTRETPPTVRRRVELRSLAALDFKSSAVTCLPVSPHKGCSSTLLDSRTPGERRSPEPELAPLARTPRPGFEPGNPSRDTSVAGRRPTRLDHRGTLVDEDSNLGLVPPRHESSAAGPSTQKWLYIYSSVGARTKATAHSRPRRGRASTVSSASNATPVHAGSRPFRARRRRQHCRPRVPASMGIRPQYSDADVGI